MNNQHMLHLCTGPTQGNAPQPRNSIYLPIAVKPEISNGVSAESAVFAQLLVNDSRQEHGMLIWCQCLQAAAQWRCNDMIAGRYFAHCNSNGVCPNAVARAAGCKLPAEYADRANSIESLAAGSPDPHTILNSLIASPRHADHLLGRNDFFRKQTHYAIGYAADRNSEYGFYWTILIAQCL